jgi:hypothetical protein
MQVCLLLLCNSKITPINTTLKAFIINIRSFNVKRGSY